MREFLKWLGVNEKVAKVAIWLFIIMVCMIVINTALDSLGLPYYKITVDNLVKIDVNWVTNGIISLFLTLINIYTILFLIFPIKDFKKIFPYSVLYLALNIILTIYGNYLVTQLFIILFVIIFSYFYSGKKSKYVLYAIISIVINAIIQYIWFTYKAKAISINEISNATKTVLTLDFFIIMLIIILAKEIYLKKRR
mgnify:CR=1 FL=1